MSEFYTNCQCRGNYVYYRGYKDGKRIFKRVLYSPTLFIDCKDRTEFKTIEGKNVLPMEFETIRDARDYIHRYETVQDHKIYGMTSFEYCYLADKFKLPMEIDRSLITVAYLDIETDSSQGNALPSNADREVTAIGLLINGTYRLWGMKKYKKHRPDVEYIYCKDEQELLLSFLKEWRVVMPDIVTGWYSSGYDIPYLINRYDNVFGEGTSKDLSPFGIIKDRTVRFSSGLEMEIHDIFGVANLDYQTLYKKDPTLPKLEKYSLDFVSYTELKKQKLSFKDMGDLNTLYERDPQRFYEYNIRDVELVKLLDDKLKLIDNVLALAYDAKANYLDAYYQTRMWDCLIFNDFVPKKLVLPPKRFVQKSKKYAGAFVKEPKPGYHKWIVSFDLNSLYPHIMAQWNISPETLVPGLPRKIDIDALVERKYDLSDLPGKNLTMAANGHFFKREMGFLPRMLMKAYDDRKVYKKKMLEAKTELALVEAEMKKRGLIDDKKED